MLLIKIPEATYYELAGLEIHNSNIKCKQIYYIIYINEPHLEIP